MLGVVANRWNGLGAVALLDEDTVGEVRRNAGGSASDTWTGLVSGFRLEARLLLERLAAALSGDDGERVRERAHCLRQTAVAMGAARVAVLCRDLEGRTLEEPARRLGTRLEPVRMAVDETIAALR